MEMRNYTKAFEKLYGTDSRVLKEQTKRYQRLNDEFLRLFDKQEQFFFSTPGRTELSGNHTDHNHGRVLAASVNLDSIAAASKNNTQTIVLHSEGFFRSFKVDLKFLEVDEKEKETTTALIRGIAARFAELGYQTGGFSACMTSDVLPGSGLSSSASVEVLIGSIFNHLYNEGQIPAETIAQIGQYAENVYFGKPCGLMDQMACAVGGIIAIDFKNPQEAQIDKIVFDFNRHNYNLVIVDTGGNHVDLTDDYASVPAEMKAVAAQLNKSTLRELQEDKLIENLAELRNSVGDRAILRALHYFEENKRVFKQIKALKAGNFQRFLELVKLSGSSSFRWLQNIYTIKNVREQGVSLALALSEKYISEIGAGACRVHGGGFAGTIQVFLPAPKVSGFQRLMEPVFGKKSIQELHIRQFGTVLFKEIE